MLTAGLYAQARPAGQPAEVKPQLSEEAFKNVRVLKGIPVKEFMATMGFFSASLAFNCTDCHGGASASDWANYAIDTPLKNRARQMMTMVKAINDANFGGRPFVTCYTCHRGSQRPKVVPSLAVQYGEPPPEDPDESNRYPERVRPRRRIRFSTSTSRRLAARRPGQAHELHRQGHLRRLRFRLRQGPGGRLREGAEPACDGRAHGGGDATSTYDGREAWHAAPATLVPVPLMPLVGADLGGARLDAQLAFPGQIKQLLTNWRADFRGRHRSTTSPSRSCRERCPIARAVKLYFDRASGLLVRQTRYAPTAVGTVPLHIVYSDYRVVPGIDVKIPFNWQVTWVDGQYTINVASVQPNAAIDAARFAKPAPPR